MPLNGPREGSVALSSNRVCKDVPLPPRSTHASRMLSQNLLFHARHACLSTYVIPHMYRPAPPSLIYLKIYLDEDWRDCVPKRTAVAETSNALATLENVGNSGGSPEDNKILTGKNRRAGGRAEIFGGKRQLEKENILAGVLVECSFFFFFSNGLEWSRLDRESSRFYKYQVAGRGNIPGGSDATMEQIRRNCEICFRKASL